MCFPKCLKVASTVRFLKDDNNKEMQKRGKGRSQLHLYDTRVMTTHEVPPSSTSDMQENNIFINLSNSWRSLFPHLSSTLVPFFFFFFCWIYRDIIFIYFFFYWRIIALQNFVVFYQTSPWISHSYIYIPSLLNLPPYPIPLGWYITYGNITFHVTPSIHLTLSSPPLLSPCL